MRFKCWLEVHERGGRSEGHRKVHKYCDAIFNCNTWSLSKTLWINFFPKQSIHHREKRYKNYQDERRRENSGGTSRVTCKQEDKTREGGPSKRRELWPTFVKAISRRVLKTQNSYKCCLMDNYFCQYKFIFSWSGTKTHQICLLLIMAVSQSYRGENVA